MTKTEKAQAKFNVVMHEWKRGKLHHGGTGEVVKHPEEENVALAIAFSEAREIDPKFKRNGSPYKNPPIGIVRDSGTDQQKKLDELLRQKEAMEAQKAEIREKENLVAGPEKYELFRERMEINKQIGELEAKIINQQNAATAATKGGSITALTDKKGKEHPDIPDFRSIDTSEIIFEEDAILTEPRPDYIPVIDEEVFVRRGFVFDAMRIDEDSYLVAISAHSEKQHTDYVLLTLDQLVLTSDYYHTKARAQNIEEAKRKNLLKEEYWDQLPTERKERFLNQRGLYNKLPAKIKKQVTEGEWEGLTWQEKEELHKFFKRVGPKRITSKLKDNEMWSSTHAMYERFVDPEAKRKERDRRRYAHPEVFDYWRNFRDMLNWKIKDIKVHREDIADVRKVAIETSFGMSNTNDVLKGKYGILVKRQDGSQINPVEIDQVETAWAAAQRFFGNLRPLASRENLKVSHTGTRYVFASRAIGVFVPSMGTIGVSYKYGDDQMADTTVHEITHWLDHTLGEVGGKRYATDNYESTPGKIAFAFRKNMNMESTSDYVNATKECFARAMQQHYAVTVRGEGAQVHYSEGDVDPGTPYFTADNFIPKDVYEETIKPLIEEFFEENKELLQPDKDKAKARAKALVLLMKMQGGTQRVEDSDKEKAEARAKALSLLMKMQEPTEELTMYRGRDPEAGGPLELGSLGVLFGSEDKSIAREFGKQVYEIKFRPKKLAEFQDRPAALAHYFPEHQEEAERLWSEKHGTEEEHYVALLGGEVTEQPFDPYSDADRLLIPKLKADSYDALKYLSQTFETPEYMIIDPTIITSHQEILENE